LGLGKKKNINNPAKILTKGRPKNSKRNKSYLEKTNFDEFSKKRKT